MYAIRSYYEINNSAPEEKNTIYSEQTLKYLNEVSGRFNKIISMEEELIKRQKHVITSYSIHYTKLYEYYGL